MSDKLQGSGWKYRCCQVADAARQEGYDYGIEKTAVRIAELEADNSDLAGSMMRFAERTIKAESRIAELEAEVSARDMLRSTNDILANGMRLAESRIAELEAERDYHVKAHDSATLRIAQLTKQVAELEATVAEAVVDAAYWKRRATRNAE